MLHHPIPFYLFNLVSLLTPKHTFYSQGLSWMQSKPTSSTVCTLVYVLVLSFNSNFLLFPCTSLQFIHCQGLPSPPRFLWYVPDSSSLCQSSYHSDLKQVSRINLTSSYPFSHSLPGSLTSRHALPSTLKALSPTVCVFIPSPLAHSSSSVVFPNHFILYCNAFPRFSAPCFCFNFFFPPLLWIVSRAGIFVCCVSSAQKSIWHIVSTLNSC